MEHGNPQHESLGRQMCVQNKKGPATGNMSAPGKPRALSCQCVTAVLRMIFISVVFLMRQNGAVVRTVASQHRGSVFESSRQRPFPRVCIFSSCLCGFSGFLPPLKDMYIRSISYSKSGLNSASL